jgi:hypothetical protein
VYTARLPTADHRGRWITREEPKRRNSSPIHEANTNVGTGGWYNRCVHGGAALRGRALARAKRSADAIAGANAKVA